MKCSVCGENVNIVLLRDNKYYCDACWYAVNPPILVLAKTWYHQNLFCPKLNKYVYPTKHQFDVCGFRLFNQKIFFNRETNKKYKEVLIYRYSGRQRCQAIDGYTAWPSCLPKCSITDCTLREYNNKEN